VREKEEDVKRGRKNIFLILMMYMVRAFYNKSEFGLMKWSNSGVLKICTLSRPWTLPYIRRRRVPSHGSVSRALGPTPPGPPQPSGLFPKISSIAFMCSSVS
jgi:hypothetical protein